MAVAPYDPDGAGAVIPEPTAAELRDLRRIVRERLHGTVYKDRHDDRYTRVKQAPGKFKSVNVPLTNCGYENVLCDIPIEGSKGCMRICLVCDGGNRLLGLAPG